MKLCLFDNLRVGVVDGDTVRDVTGALDDHDTRLGTPFWVRMCASFDELTPRLAAAAERADPVPLTSVTLRAPVLNPSKVVGVASNYGAHVEEMRDRVEARWLLDFDVFLKAPSSIVGPGATVRLPEVAHREIHHEVELAVVIGRTARHVPPDRALEHVLGITCLLDLTVRGDGDRSRRKSYDGFTPVGPWLVTLGDAGDLHDQELRLSVNGTPRQQANTRDLLTSIPEMLARASTVMTLLPGDVFSTGTPAGVGPLHAGDHVTAEISGVGTMTIQVDDAPSTS